jgi:hypothetical protein
MRERIAHIARQLGVPLAVGLVLGLIGPFGTFDLLPAGMRLAYWLAIIMVNWLLTDAILRRVYAVAGDRMPVPGLAVPLSGAFIAALPATAVVALANGLSGIGWPENVAVLFGQVLLLLAAISLPVYAWEDMRDRTDGEADPLASKRPAKSTQARESEARPPNGDGLSIFNARFSAPLQGRILCLEMQDHYLVVHHSSGSEMILCRMEDAARELEDLGQRVHRSWWVAADAVDGVERVGQRTFLRLTDGRLVPVGRSFRPKLKTAGWL